MENSSTSQSLELVTVVIPINVMIGGFSAEDVKWLAHITVRLQATVWKCISWVHENHSNNPIKLIVHLLICFGSDFTLALGAVYD